MGKKNNKLSEAQEIITSRLELFFKMFSNKESNPHDIKPRLGKQIIQDQLLAECKEEWLSEIIEQKLWQIFKQEIDGIIIEKISNGYDVIALEKLIIDRIKFAIGSSENLKFQFPDETEEPFEETKRKIADKVWKRWVKGDLEKIINGNRFGFDYSKMEVIAKEIDDIIFDEEPKLIPNNKKNDYEVEDKRKVNDKIEICLTEYFKIEKYNKDLTNTELTPIIKKWIYDKYGKDFSGKTIRPLLSQYRK